jgi:hypothetical protein
MSWEENLPPTLGGLMSIPTEPATLPSRSATESDGDVVGTAGGGGLATFRGDLKNGVHSFECVDLQEVPNRYYDEDAEEGKKGSPTQLAWFFTLAGNADAGTMVYYTGTSGLNGPGGTGDSKLQKVATALGTALSKGDSIRRSKYVGQSCDFLVKNEPNKRGKVYPKLKEVV